MTRNSESMAGGSGGGALEEARYAALLERQHALATELDGLSRLQESLVEDSEPSAGAELVELVARRQVVVDELVRNDGALSALRRVFSRADTANRSAAIAGLLEAVRTRDEASRKVLEARRDAIAKELVELSAGRRAQGAYGSSVSRGPRFQDREA